MSPKEGDFWGAELLSIAILPSGEKADRASKKTPVSPRSVAFGSLKVPFFVRSKRFF